MHQPKAETARTVSEEARTMHLHQYIARREVRDPDFREALKALQPELAFRRELIQARLAAGLTQQQLAQRIGTKQSSISRLESGTAEPSFDMLRRLAAALNVSFEILPTAAIEVHAHEPVSP
jgi:ribosome-binding protein aMBF1 (putative translation factor)